MFGLMVSIQGISPNKEHISIGMFVMNQHDSVTGAQYSLLNYYKTMRANDKLVSLGYL